jgi:hypothetical protein
MVAGAFRGCVWELAAAVAGGAAYRLSANERGDPPVRVTVESVSASDPGVSSRRCENSLVSRSAAAPVSQTSYLTKEPSSRRLVVNDVPLRGERGQCETRPRFCRIDKVDHTNYFVQPETATFIAEKLEI